MQVAAERAAWDASKKDGFELVTICPTFVVGPVISNRADATSILDVKVCHILPTYKQHQTRSGPQNSKNRVTFFTNLSL